MGFAISTFIPSEQKPYGSGGATWIRATSICLRPEEINEGISLAEMGV